ncbi:MAG TPA: methyltransferase domain-containing protein [Burkholderiales bacterium]
MADQGTEGLLSPFLRARRVAAAKPYLHGHVLDVGCGSGAMAQFVPPERYVGVEPDEQSLAIARACYPRHRFISSLPTDGEQFDTVISLAVIEHVHDPAHFLRDLALRLKHASSGRIVCTTPHPAADWIHTTGSAIGLFSRHASEEHEELLDRGKLENIAGRIGLRLAEYRRFLFGVNQLAVFDRANAS